MDCGSIYIKMCEKAKEIQKLYKYAGIFDGFGRLKQGIVFSNNDVLFQDESPSSIKDILGYPKRIIWLPRQDQLQEMITQDWKKALALIFAYAKNYDMTQCESMEQLWFAFVMREKYQKVWSGTDWVKEG